MLSSSGYARVTTLDFSLVCGGSETPGWQAIVDAFNEHSKDVQVRMSVLPGGWNEYVQSLLIRSAAGKSPDIGRFATAYMPEFVSKKLLVDLMPYAIRDKFDFGAYHPAPFRDSTIGKSLFGMPAGVYTLGNYYNRTMFKEAGLPQPVLAWDKAWTWDEFRAVCKKLSGVSGSGGGKRWPLAHVLGNAEFTIEYVWQNGGDLIDKAGKRCLADTSAFVEAFSFMDDLMNRDKVATTAWPAFESGKLGIFPQGQWMIPGLSKAIGSKFEWGVAPLPRGRAGAATYQSPDPFVIFSGSKKKDAAWKALRFFASREAELILADNALMGVPVLKELGKYKGLFSQMSDDDRKVWTDSLSYTKTIKYTTAAKDVNAIYDANIGRMLQRKVSPEAAAKAISAEVNKLLARAR